MSLMEDADFRCEKLGITCTATEDTEDSEAAANKGRRSLTSSTPGRAALRAVGEAAAKAMPGDLDAKARLAAQLAARRQGARTQMAHSEHTHIHLW